jgi:hypothetical protein
LTFSPKSDIVRELKCYVVVFVKFAKDPWKPWDKNKAYARRMSAISIGTIFIGDGHDAAGRGSHEADVNRMVLTS